MTTPRGRAQQNTEPDRYGAPTGGGHAQGGHDFTLQAVMDLKQSVGELKESIRGMQTSLGSIEQRLGKTGEKIEAGLEKFESKLDKRLSSLEDEAGEVKSTLKATKWVLIVLSVVGTSLLGVAGWVAKEVWDLSRPLIIEKLNAPAAQPKPAPAAQPTPAPAPAAAPGNRRP